MPARRREPLARDLPAELQVAATNGSIVTDSRGRTYIDFVMGWCVGNFGWRPAAIAKAIGRFKGPDYVYPGTRMRRGRSWRGCSPRWPPVR
jgi:4-aminobutyrate aminotransferase-like enzyme